nr:hypothetical protein [Acetobacter ascendens]
MRTACVLVGRMKLYVPFLQFAGQMVAPFSVTKRSSGACVVCGATHAPCGVRASIWRNTGYTLAQQLQRPSIRRVFNRITGSVFVGFGAVLLRGRA